MMFALLQEQHRVQLEAMVTENQKSMDAMFERMNAIVTGNSRGGPTDKENIPPVGNVNLGNNNGGTKQTNKKCPHCGKHVFHKLADCYKLEANASKRWNSMPWQQQTKKQWTRCSSG